MFGASGAVISISNVDPKTSVQLYDAAKAQRVDEVHRLQKRILELSKLYSYGAAISCLKACMELLGVCDHYTTSPLLPVDDAARDALQELLTEHELI